MMVHHTAFLLSHNAFLLIAAIVSVVGLVVLIAVFKLNPFLSLFLAALSLAVVTGMPAAAIVHSFEAGVGGALGHIAIVVALGTMLGKMLAESGGADQIAHTIVRVFGEKNVSWAMMVIGLLVGLPAFFEVGFVLLIPVVFTVARRTGTSLVLVGLPMLAGLSVVHGLVPPHPAALMAVTIFKADVGKTILYALIVGLPTVATAGPMYARFIAPRIRLAGESRIAAQFVEREPERRLPSFGLTLLTILLPVLLMLLGSGASLFAGQGSRVNGLLRFIGNDDMALLIGALFSFITLGKMQGFSRQAILRFSNECLAPTASVTLLVGAGAGFGRILQDCGAAGSILVLASHSHVPLLLLAWTLAAMMRLATGSSTVAMTTAAGIVAPLALQSTTVQPELLAIATGAGSLIFSHVNDGGFWLVKEYFNMSVGETLKTWSVCETIISVTALFFTFALSRLI